MTYSLHPNHSITGGDETRDAEEQIDVVINPRELGADPVVGGTSLHALFVLADGSTLERLAGQSPDVGTGSKWITWSRPPS